MSRFRLRADRLLALAFLAGTGAAFAQDESGDAAPAAATYDGRIYVLPMLSYTVADDHRQTKDALGGTVAVGKRITDALEIEARLTYNNYFARSADKDTQLYGIGAAANLFPAPESQLIGGLYLHLGVMYGHGRKEPGTVPKYSTTLFDAGLGYEWKLTDGNFGILPPGVALRVEGLFRGDVHGRDLNGGAATTHRSFKEPVVNLGIKIPFGGYAEPAPAPAPAEETPQVVPVADVPAEPAAPEPPPASPCQLPEAGKPVDLSGCKPGDTVVLHGVVFEFNKSTLTPNAKVILDAVADALLAVPEIKVEVDGHTDGRGGAAYNQKLSEARARTVLKYLGGHGVGTERMSAKGFGKTQPIADNGSDEGREQNRRVELKIVEGRAGEAAAAPAAAEAPAADAAAPAGEAAASE